MHFKYYTTVFILMALINFKLVYAETSTSADLSATQIGEARLFSGKILSVNDVELPIVVTVLEDNNGHIFKLLVTYFVPEAISLFIEKYQLEQSEDKTTFSAVSKDPRGFDINWTAQINNGQLTGVYFQPRDSGEFILKEVKQPAS